MTPLRCIFMGALATAAAAHDPGSHTLLPGAVREELGTVYPVTRLCEIKYDISPIENFNEILQVQSRNLTHLKNFINIDPSLSSEHAKSLTNSLNILMYFRIHSFKLVHSSYIRSY